MPAREMEQFERFVSSLVRTPAPDPSASSRPTAHHTSITIINAPKSCRIYVGGGAEAQIAAQPPSPELP